MSHKHPTKNPKRPSSKAEALVAQSAANFQSKVEVAKRVLDDLDELREAVGVFALQGYGEAILDDVYNVDSRLELFSDSLSVARVKRTEQGWADAVGHAIAKTPF